MIRTGNLMYDKKCDGDRFIPPRINLKLDFSYQLINNATEKYVDVLDQNKNDWATRNYEDYVGKLIGCDYKCNRVLPFTNAKTAKIDDTDRPWPVRARKKPSIGAPHSILDLPNFFNLFRKNVLDWGRNNFIAAALFDSVYMWNAENSQTIPIQSHHSSAIKWHPVSSELFIANPHSIKVWDITTAKVKYSFQRHCFSLSCTILAVDWHPYVNVQATGCNRGMLMLMGDQPNNYKALHPMDPVYNPIINVSFSPNGRYIASSSMSSFVNIWTFPDGIPYFRVRMSGSTRGMSWHPVKQSYLCLGDVTGVMSLLNVSEMNLVANYTPPNHRAHNMPKASIYCLTFSEITGELVTSHFIHATENCNTARSQVNVLSSFNKLVDRFDSDPNDKIMYLKWNPDGTQIATAGSDESLQLWNFTPRRGKKRRLEFSKSTEKLPRLGQVKFTDQLGFPIR